MSTRTKKSHHSPFSYFFFLISLAFVVYMPLHVFIVQSASTITGGLGVWKAAKDVAIFVLGPLLLYAAYKKGLWQDKTFRWLLILGCAYGLLHGLFLLLDGNDHTYSALVGSVYNFRLLGFLLLGYVVGISRSGGYYLKVLATAATIIAAVVAFLGLLQYFVLPHDFLESFGYTLERGVKPLFFIDDKPDLPRIMSTLKDPNSLGAYLVLPIMLTVVALFKKGANAALFVRPFRKEVLWVFLAVLASALFLTFSRGSAIALFLSLATVVVINHRAGFVAFLRRYILLLTAVVVVAGVGFLGVRDTYLVENVIYHADDSTQLTDPNRLRIELFSVVLDDVVEQPLGYGPGSAGLVSIRNPQGTVLTENYYLQIAYEVGWLGLVIFLALMSVIAWTLLRNSDNPLALALLASLVGYLFYSLLIHLWSNEALALQWWLLAGAVLGLVSARSSNKQFE